MPIMYYYYYHNSYWGDQFYSVVYITDVSCEVKDDDLYIYFSGNTVSSGTFLSAAYLDKSETFTDNYDIASDCIVPGETYTLLIIE